MAPCGVCGGPLPEYSGRGARRKYCPGRCAKIAQEDARRAYRVNPDTGRVRSCLGCGSQWCNIAPSRVGSGRRNSGPLKYCSSACRDAILHGYGVADRRCRTCDVLIPKRHSYCVECRPPKRRTLPVVERTRLFERDGWLCQICFGPLDENDYQPVWSRTGVLTRRFGSSYPTLDHIVPRSAGGDDSDSNLRAACWQCNTVRGPARVFAA